MSRSTMFLSLVCGALGVGCQRDSGDTGTPAADTTQGSPAADGTVSVEPTTSTGLDPTSASGDGSTGSSSTVGGSSTDTFVTGALPGFPDLAAGPCDAFAQDCPMGQKCAAWANDGGPSWNTTKCVPVTGDQIPGEACTAKGNGVSGEDDCIKGAMCWDLDAENVGTCVALCTGSPDAPTCAEGFFCPLAGDGVLNLCLPECDPLAQDCAGDELCLPNQGTFLCLFDASGEQGQAFDPCEFVDECDPGLLCADSSVASECDPASFGCCTPLCSLSAMAACPGVGQECGPFFEPGQAPPEYVDVGFCTIPM